MSSQSRKVPEFALRSSLEMLVLILITFVTAAVGDHLSCNEYCSSLKSAQTGSSTRSECNCHPQYVGANSNNSQNLDGNPIYYEPVEFHPLPDISFVYQPFIISNPTSLSDNKPITRSLSSQESEHHRKYKRKDNVIHKISIDTSKNPLYLDIDIENNLDQNNVNGFDDVEVTEQNLKDCIDLHLLFHFRRNESDKVKLNWNVEKLEKYFHISDDDLIIELNKRCKQPSDIVDQSLRQIKERIRVIKPQYFNYSAADYISDTDYKWNKTLGNAHEDITRVNKSLISISTNVPRVIPDNNSYHNINKEEKNRSNILNDKYINNTRHSNLVVNEIIKINEESSSVIPIQLELDKSVNAEEKNENKFASNKLDATNKTSKHINSTPTTPDNIDYRAVFNKPGFEQDKPLLSLLNKVGPEKEIEMASTPELRKFYTLHNIDENKNKLDGDLVINSEDFLRMAPVNTIIAPQSSEKNDKSSKLNNIVNEMFTSTTQISLTDPSFVIRGSNLNKDLIIENTSVRDNNINTRTFTTENDLEQSSSNMEHIIAKYTDNLPEITTKNVIGKSKWTRRSDEHFVDSTDRNMYKYNPTAEREVTTIRSINETPISSPIYSDDNVTLLMPTNEGNVSKNRTYVNRTIIPENKFQIPRIIVTEFSNETVDTTIDGIEDMSNNDYVGLTNFEMDVADLTSNNVNSTKDNLNRMENDENNETLGHIKPSIGKEAGESFETSEISGNIYFLFKKMLIPMRFTQAPDGELRLLLDGASFCKKILSGVNNNGILAILCNSAVHDNNKCTKT